MRKYWVKNRYGRGRQLTTLETAALRQLAVAGSITAEGRRRLVTPEHPHGLKKQLDELTALTYRDPASGSDKGALVAWNGRCWSITEWGLLVAGVLDPPPALAVKSKLERLRAIVHAVGSMRLIDFFPPWSTDGARCPFCRWPVLGSYETSLHAPTCAWKLAVDEVRA